jgi:hypothetical protein
MKFSHLSIALLGVALLGGCGGKSGNGTAAPGDNTPPAGNDPSPAGNDPSPAGNSGPTAAFSVTCSSLSCTFNDQSSDSDGTIASWSWAFGDGATSTAANPSHDYAATSHTQFAVELTVTDNDGGQAVASQSFMVSPPIRLQCQNAASLGEYTDCTLPLPAAAKIEIELTSRECVAAGNTLELLLPVQATLFTDGCYSPEIGTVFTMSDNGNPFPAGTEISLQMLSGSGLQEIPPSLILLGTEDPPWVLRFDDGNVAPADNDITITVRPVP